MISHEHKCIFIHPSRNGGKSIEKALFGVTPVFGSSDHRTLVDWQQKLGKKTFNNYFKFVFVRNPWDRLVSIYHYVLENYSFFYPTDEKIRGDFRSFNAFITKCQPYLKRTKAQYNWLTNINENIGVDFIGRVENYEKDWKKVCEQLNIGDVCLPHLNKSSHEKYWTYYDEHLEEIVADKFKEDIELFDYKFK